MQFKGLAMGWAIGAAALLLACDRQVPAAWRYEAEPGPITAPATSEARLAWGTEGGLHLTDLRGAKICVFREGGAVAAAPALLGNRVWFGTADGEVFAIDERCAPRWRVSVAGRVSGGIIQAAGALYFTTFSGRIVALDAATGERRWMHPAPEDPPYRAFVGGSPVSVGNWLYAGRQEGEILVLDRESGELQARIDTGPVLTPLTRSGDRVWFFDAEGTLGELEGEGLMSRFELGRAAAGPPLVTEQRVYVTDESRRIRAVNRQNGRVLWDFPTRGPVNGRMALFRGRLVAAGGSGDPRLYVLEPESGEGGPVFTAGRRFAAGVRVSPSAILAPSEDGTLYAFEALRPPR